MADAGQVEVFDANPPAADDMLGAGLVDVIQARLNTMIGKSSGFLETLPAQVQARINFLRELQDKHDEYETAYQSELKALQAKYNALYAPLYAERSAVVNGEKEVPKEDSVAEDKPKEGEGGELVPPGIPDFWLGVMRANPIVSEHLSEKDEEVLAYLTDITSEDLEGTVDEDGDEMAGFKLSFHFKPNPFFDHPVLTKTYHIFDEDGEPMLHKAEGTDIEWKQGKNVTVKLMKKKAKPARGKPAASAKTVTKIEPVASFFNFFKPPQEPEDEDIDEDEIEELRSALEEDFEIGELMRSRLIPHAVRWYTGEANEDDEDDEDDDEDEYGDDNDDEDDDDDDEDDEEDDDDEADEEHEAKGAHKKGGSTKGLKGGEAMSDKGEKPPECKQQ